MFPSIFFRKGLYTNTFHFIQSFKFFESFQFYYLGTLGVKLIIPLFKQRSCFVICPRSPHHWGPGPTPDPRADLSPLCSAASLNKLSTQLNPTNINTFMNKLYKRKEKAQIEILEHTRMFAFIYSNSFKSVHKIQKNGTCLRSWVSSCLQSPL